MSEDPRPLSGRLGTIVRTLFPLAALRHISRRDALATYEAAKPGRFRKQRKDSRDADSMVLEAGQTVRETARYIDRNNDIGKGAIRTLVNNTVGANGIGVRPRPLTNDGKPAKEFAKVLGGMFEEWSYRPEVTAEQDYAGCQRSMAKSWVRDGEGLSQIIEGTGPTIRHGSAVPLSLELLEPDLLPLDLFDDTKRIRQGIERNGWNRAVAFHLLKTHPGDLRKWVGRNDTRRVSADRILHIKMTDRIGQGRGVSLFAAVIARLEDISDYEHSERIAARIASKMAVAVIKGVPERYGDVPTEAEKAPDNEGKRLLHFEAGMVFDDLAPGEKLEPIGSNGRPNAGMEDHRNGQLRAVAAGLGISFSSLAKLYDGTYSAQRQELVEQWINYAVFQSDFTSQFVRPTYSRVVAMAILSGAVQVPSNVNPLTVARAIYTRPQMPWIDPKKEAEANKILERMGVKTGYQIVMQLGGIPEDVIEEEGEWRDDNRARGNVIDGDPANDSPPAALQGPGENTDENDDDTDDETETETDDETETGGDDETKET